MNKSILQITIYLVTTFLILYILFLTAVAGAFLAKQLGFEVINNVGINIGGIDTLLGFCGGLLLTYFFYLLRKILVIIFDVHPFSMEIYKLLNTLKTVFFVLLGIKVLKYVAEIFMTSSFEIGFSENLIWIFIVFIFIDIYQQSIRTYQEHQLTI